jgi:AraC-like DNA-binding protein
MSKISNIRDFDIAITHINLVLEQTKIRDIIPKRKSGRPIYGLVYVIEGSAHYYFNNGSNIIVNPGEALLLTKGSIYSFEIKTDTYYLIYVDFDIITDTNINLSDTVYTFKNPEIAENLFRKLYKQWLYKQPAHKLKCKSILYDILVLIFQNQASVYVPTVKNEKIKTAISYMENNFADESLDILKLAKMSNMSEVHFRRLFNEIYHIPPSKYLRILRISRAKDLLKCGRYSVTSVAEMVGFANVYYFSKTFKDETGISPSEYKDMCNNKNT